MSRKRRRLRQRVRRRRSTRHKPLNNNRISNNIIMRPLQRLKLKVIWCQIRIPIHYILILITTPIFFDIVLPLSACHRHLVNTKTSQKGRPCPIIIIRWTVVHLQWSHYNSSCSLGFHIRLVWCRSVSRRLSLALSEDSGQNFLR